MATDSWFIVSADTDGHPQYVDQLAVNYVGTPMDGNRTEDAPHEGATQWLLRVYGEQSELDALSTETGVVDAPTDISNTLNSLYSGDLSPTDKSGWEDRFNINEAE